MDTYSLQAAEVTLAFHGPNKSGNGGTPNGWTFSESDPTTGSVACNSWKYGPSSAWAGSNAPITAHLAFDGVDQLDWRNVDQFESGWDLKYDPSKRITQYSYAKGGENSWNNWNLTLNFCNSVTLQQVILVPLRASYNITSGTLQYKDASGAWQDAGVNGETKAGIGMAMNNSANYRVFGAASTSSKYWRVTSIKSNNHFSGAQVKVAGATTTTTTAAAQATYKTNPDESAYYNTCQDPAYEPITTEADCKQMITDFIPGGVFKGSAATGHWPPGCFRYQGVAGTGVFLGTSAAGRGHDGHVMVCKRKA
jgi:hypothetical protein